MDGTVDDTSQLQEVPEPAVQPLTHLTKHAKSYAMVNMSSFTDDEWEANALKTCCGLTIGVPAAIDFIGISDVVGRLSRTVPPTCPECLKHWEEAMDDLGESLVFAFHASSSVKANEPGLPAVDNTNP